MQLKRRAAGILWGASSFAAWATNAATPYYGRPLPLPGLIQPFEYDRGGEGVAYHNVKNESEFWSIRRDEAISLVAHTGVGGGYRMGWVHPGAWVRFTVQVPETGRYEFSYFYSSGLKAGSRMKIVLDDHQDLDELFLPYTLSWDARKWIQGSTVELVAGVHFVKFHFMRAEAAIAEAPCCADFCGFKVRRVP